jgi:hypothetical protein
MDELEPAVLGRDVFLGGHVVEEDVEDDPEIDRGVRLASRDSSELADAIMRVFRRDEMLLL